MIKFNVVNRWMKFVVYYFTRKIYVGDESFSTWSRVIFVNRYLSWEVIIIRGFDGEKQESTNMHSIESSGGGGKFLAGGGDRRLRPHPHHQDLNCPRCDSSNTKFCYYNNYNLSQPRHFCKSCRRYWTKGGVLRNVPVGGGVRKPKRSTKPKPNTPSHRMSSNSENSSSDSSSLTATTTTEVSGTNSTPPMLLSFNQPSTRFFNIPQSSTPVTTFDQSAAGNMSPEIRTFTSLMTSSTDQLPLAFDSAVQLHHHNTEHVVENQNPNQLQWMHTDEKMPEIGSSGFMDQTAEMDLSGLGSRRSNSGLAGTEDWQDSVDEGLFDLTGTVDQSDWSQSQWNHDHHPLNYFP